jgi:hypothetical protein
VVVQAAELLLPPAAVLYLPLNPPEWLVHCPLWEYEPLPLSSVRGVG